MENLALSGLQKGQATVDIASHYRSGSTRVLCLVMQCIGFNNNLYEELSSRRNEKLTARMEKTAKKLGKLSKKRKLSEDESNAMLKKLKWF